MRNKFFIILLISCISFWGCQTTSSDKSLSRPKEKATDVQSAIEAVADVMTTHKAQIKYCPVCGKRFSPSVETCSEDGTKLQFLE
ncbi:MAG: hypothetical protein PHY73_07955 [Candidatus Omnitrophica bacterium]|nr:hypothetical protein [Candidatus Omnitrophota bacterium]